MVCKLYADGTAHVRCPIHMYTHLVCEPFANYTNSIVRKCVSGFRISFCLVPFHLIRLGWFGKYMKSHNFLRLDIFSLYPVCMNAFTSHAWKEGRWRNIVILVTSSDGKYRFFCIDIFSRNKKSRRHRQIFLVFGGRHRHRVNLPALPPIFTSAVFSTSAVNRIGWWRGGGMRRIRGNQRILKVISVDLGRKLACFPYADARDWWAAVRRACQQRAKISIF